MTTYRRRKSSAPPLWGFVAVPMGLFGLLYTANLFNADFQANSRTLTEISRNTAGAEMETAYAEAEQARAVARYQNGVCVQVPNGLVEGQRFETLQPGDTVCTNEGVTAKIGADLTAIEIARTSNIEVVRVWRGW